MFALYWTKDIFFGSRVTATARAVGGELRVVGSLEELLQQADSGDCSLVLLDLDTPGLDPAAAMAGLRERNVSPPVIAFGSHVHETRLEAAQQAGCDRVLARGQFDRQMSDILRTHLTK